jgi:hypothetical protein
MPARQLAGLPALLDPLPDPGAQIRAGVRRRLLIEMRHQQRLCGAGSLTGPVRAELTDSAVAAVEPIATACRSISVTSAAARRH